MDIDGSDAFDRLLDRLLTAKHESEDALERLREMERAQRALVKERDDAVSALHRERNNPRRASALKEMHEAAGMILRTPTQEVAERLKKALGDAAIYCGSDDIPF